MKPVDNLCTTRQSSAQVIHIVAMYLTKAVRSILAGEPLRRIARGRCLVLLGVLCIVGTTQAEAMTNIDYYKLYAHSRIIDANEYRCLEQLYTKESNWNPKARTGSHYGIPQMRNDKLRSMDAYTQIDWGLRYIKGRYKTPCKAWAFFKAKGYH
jgi:hypothetical protein